MIIVGIDPGLSGAVCLYSTISGDIDVWDMPTVEVLRSGKKKRELNINLLAKRLEICGSTSCAVFLERVGAMPGQGVSSTFAFGRNVGIIEGIVGARVAPITIVPPQTWQKAMNVRGGKDGARLRATELFPKHADLFARVKDDGRADATLIAKYGASMLQK